MGLTYPGSLGELWSMREYEAFEYVTFEYVAFDRSPRAVNGRIVTGGSSAPPPTHHQRKALKKGPAPNLVAALEQRINGGGCE